MGMCRALLCIQKLLLDRAGSDTCSLERCEEMQSAAVKLESHPGHTENFKVFQQKIFLLFHHPFYKLFRLSSDSKFHGLIISLQVFSMTSVEFVVFH